MKSVPAPFVFPRVAFALALLWNSAVCAQSAPPSGSTHTPASQVQNPSTVGVVVAHSNCDTFIPSFLMHPIPSSPPLISVHITPDGTLQQAKLFKSSGDTVWDKAALDCANGYQYGQRPVSGKRPEIEWVLAFYKFSTGSGFATAKIDSHSCNARFFPRERITLPAQAKTVVTYTVQSDGTVGEPTVTQSSGLTLLDNAVTNCVKTWRYYPVTQNGAPFTIDQTIAVEWQNRR